MLKVSDNLMDWYGNEEMMGPKRQGPSMPRVTTSTRRMTNIHLGDGEYIQGIRKNPFVDPALNASQIPDLTPPPAHKPLRYTPGLTVDPQMEGLRPVRCHQHPALSGLDLAPTKEPLDSASRPYHMNPASPMDYASSYPQDELSRIKLRNRAYQPSGAASEVSSVVGTGGYILITPSGAQVPLSVNNGGGMMSCAREAALGSGLGSVQGYSDFEPLEELKQLRNASPPQLTSVYELPTPRTILPSSSRRATTGPAPVLCTSCRGKRRPGDFGIPEHIAIRTVLLTAPRKASAIPPAATPPSTPQEEMMCGEEEEEEVACTPPSQEDEPSAPLNTPLNEEA